MERIFKCPECGKVFEVSEYVGDAQSKSGISLICDCGKRFNVRMVVRDYDIIIKPIKGKSKRRGLSWS